MPTTSAARGREVRRKLLTAAAELIAEQGWTGVHTRPLAERAGVAPGLVHYHFTSLPQLLGEAAVGVLRELVDGVGPLLERAGTPDELLDALLASIREYTGHDPASLLITEAYLAAGRDAELRAAIAGVLGEFREKLAGWLTEHGITDPAGTAAVLAAAIDGVLLHRALSPDLTAAAVRPVLHRLFTGEGRQ